MKLNSHTWALKTTVVTGCLLVSSAATGSNGLFSDMPVVLSMDKLEQAPSSTPVTISSIDREIIEASGARTIPDALRLIPGIVVGHSVNDFGNKPLMVVAYHGHSDQYSRQMNVLIDGRSIYDPLLGGVNWYNIPVSLDDIERIEVTRGPNASTYGSNSFQAVINIITRHASEDRGHFARIDAGNHDIFDATYRYGGNDGDLDYRVTLATVNDDGQDRAGGNDAHDDVNSGLVDYRLDYQVNTNNLLTYTGSLGRTRQDTDPTLRQPQPGETILRRPMRTIEDTSAHQLIRWDSTIDRQQSFTLKYYYNMLDQSDDYTALPIDLSALGLDDLDNLYLQRSYRGQRHNIEYTHYINPTRDLRMVLGVSGQQDRVDSPGFLYPTGKTVRNTGRLFGNLVWDFSDSNAIDLGILVEKNEGIETEISPRVALLHDFNDRHTLRIGVSKAVRSPFVFEQSGHVFNTAVPSINGVPQPQFTLNDHQQVAADDIRSENITSTEIGYYGKYLQDRLRLNARLFRDELSDLVVDEVKPYAGDPPDNVNGTAQFYLNRHNTVVNGLEIEVDFSISRTTRIFASGAILEIDSDDPDPKNPGYRYGKSREFSESAPDHSFSLLAMKDWGSKYSTSLGYYYVGDMAWMDANHSNTCEPPNTPPSSGCGYRNTRGYRKLDLRIARHFSLGNEEFTAAVNLQNLLDDYSDYDSAPSSGAPAVVQNLVAFFELRMRIR